MAASAIRGGYRSAAAVCGIGFSTGACGSVRAPAVDAGGGSWLNAPSFASNAPRCAPARANNAFHLVTGRSTVDAVPGTNEGRGDALRVAGGVSEAAT